MRSAETWRVTVWGTRGAIPAAGAEFLEYGGNTSCVSVCCGGVPVVFDAGSGIAQLNAPRLNGARLSIAQLNDTQLDDDRPNGARLNGARLNGARLNDIRLNDARLNGARSDDARLSAARPDGWAGKCVHLLLSHMHLDHIGGLIGFPLLCDPAAELCLYGEARDGLGLRAWLDRLFGPPYWPVGLDSCRAKITVREIGPDMQFSPANGLSVRTLRSCHPNQSLIYRLDGPGHSVVYTLDCELTEELAPRLAEFARGCDLLIWDANYAGADLQPGWGHSTWQQGLDLARTAGAARVLMTHYDRSYTDTFLRQQERLAKQQSDACMFAREGMEIVL